MNDKKKCSKCKRELSLSGFWKDKSKKDGLSSLCKDCRGKHSKQHYQDNKEVIKAHVKAYQQANKEKIAARNKKYRQENKEKITAHKKKYCQENKAQIAIHYKEYRQKHRDEILEKDRNRYQVNKEKIKRRLKNYMQTTAGKLLEAKHRHKRRAQKRGVLYEIFDPQEVFERDGWRCKHCHKKVQWLNKSPNHPFYPNLDHIVPLSKGGEHTKRNTQLLCRECNNKKRDNDVGEQLRLFG